MKVIIAENYEDGARKAADLIEQIVREKPDCTLGLATGSSPVGMYQELARRCREEGLDFSRVHSVNLDEYVGLDGTHDQSYRYFMNTNLFDHINIDKNHTYVAKGTGDIEANLKEFNEILDRTDIDIQVLGVGPDGHLGFNEPGDTLYDGAVTMGMGNIMRARRLLMIISGNKQEAATKLLIGNKIDPHCPCTFMRMHRDATVVIERKLAEEIGYRG